MAKSSGNNDQLIVVAGVEPDASGSGVRLMEQSNRSATLVDLAAPGWSIPSLSGAGDPGCFTGTSAAAPQVSFAAALLVAFGYDSPVEVRRRLLATARIETALRGEVRDGRLFDLPVALDVFADLVWMKGESTPRRGQLMPPEDGLEDDEALLQLCDPAASSTLSSSRGNVDANRLILWQAGTDGAPATIWHEDGTSITEIGTTCPPPDGAGIRFRGDASTKAEALLLKDVARIVPSRLRVGLKIAMDPGFEPGP